MDTDTRSRQCREGLHMNCQDPDCKCGDCHLTCRNGHPARVLYDGLCAECERRRVRSLPKPVAACERCGGTPAYRNPRRRDNVFLCSNCHAEDGEPVPLTSSDLSAIHADAASCAGKDILDPAHSPYNVRGNVWQCRRCKRRLATRKREVPESWKRTDRRVY